MARQELRLRILAEGLAIVVSILLAFGIQAWWEQRLERDDERAALELLLGDLNADTTELGIVEQIGQRYAQATGWLLTQWDDTDVDLPQLLDTTGVFLRWQYIQPQNAGYLSLRDANRLGLIENETVRTSTVRYFEDAQVNLSQRTDRLFSEREALIDALSLHFRLWTERDDVDSPLITNVRLVSSWPDVHQDSRVFNRVSQVRSSASTAIRASRDAQQANSSLRALIEAELEARW